MKRQLPLLVVCFGLMVSSGFAAPISSLYQIDIICFTHAASHANTMMEQEANPTLASSPHYAIPLQITGNKSHTPYHTLPNSLSALQDEYWTLNHKSQYQVLFHYTWLQPSNNQQPIALPAIQAKGWNIEGTIRVRRSNYYLLDTDMLFSDAHNKRNSFVFNQKQRLKPGVVYYLDHPQAGLLIKIHQIV